MDTNQLRFFLSVAQRLSFIEAAGEHGVSHSTMCRQIAKLEAELGVPLFVRSTHSVSLTDRGTEFIDCARRMLSALDRFRSATVPDSPENNRLRICYFAETERLAAYFTQQFSALNPEIPISMEPVLVHTLATVGPRPDSNSIYFAPAGMVKRNPDCRFISLGDRFDYLVLRPSDYRKYLSAGRKFSSRLRFAIPDPNHFRLRYRQAMSVLSDLEIVPGEIVHYTRMNEIDLDAKSGLINAVVPWGHIDPEAFVEERFLRLAYDPDKNRTVYLAAYADNCSPAVREFIACCEAAPLPETGAASTICFDSFIMENRP